MGEGAGATVNDPIDEAKDEVRQALKDRAGEPSQDAAEAARQVGELREAITRDLDGLRGRLPDRAEVSEQARSAGGGAAAGVAGAVAAGVAGVGALMVVLRRRSKRRADEERVRAQALLLARELARLDLDHDELTDDGGSAWPKLVAAVVALGAAVAGALALRQRLRGDDPDWQE